MRTMATCRRPAVVARAQLLHLKTVRRRRRRRRPRLHPHRSDRTQRQQLRRLGPPSRSMRTTMCGRRFRRNVNK